MRAYLEESFASFTRKNAIMLPPSFISTDSTNTFTKSTIIYVMWWRGRRCWRCCSKTLKIIDDSDWLANQIGLTFVVHILKSSALYFPISFITGFDFEFSWVLFVFKTKYGFKLKLKGRRKNTSHITAFNLINSPNFFDWLRVIWGYSSLTLTLDSLRGWRRGIWLHLNQLSTSIWLVDKDELLLSLLGMILDNMQGYSWNKILITALNVLWRWCLHNNLWLTLCICRNLKRQLRSLKKYGIIFCENNFSFLKKFHW